jgi:peptidyl-prolyl cis-trans isomerase C
MERHVKKNRLMVAGGVVVCAALTFGFLGLGVKKDAIATVGKTQITVQDLENRIKTFPAQYQEILSQKENKVKLLDQMIDEQLLIVSAEKEGVSKKEDFKRQIEDARRQLLLSIVIQDKIDSKVQVADDEVKNFYDSNKEQFSQQELRHAKHILVATPDQAKKLLASLKSGADFDELAKANSTDPSGKNGGDLGWFGKGQLVPEFEQAVYALKSKDQLSDVVQTKFGYHIIKLLEVRDRPALSFDQVKEDLRTNLRNKKKQDATTAYLETLKKDIKITRDISKLK